MKKSLAITLTGALTGALTVALVLTPIGFASAKESKNPYGTGNVDPAAPNEVILTITKG